MKKILTILFVLICFFSEAQTWQQIFSRNRFVFGLGVPVRDTFTGTSADTAHLVLRPQNGALYYKYKTSWIQLAASVGNAVDSIWLTGGDPDTLRYRSLGITYTVGVITGGGGSSYTFTNGLTESAGTVVLGGTLTQNTTITGDNYQFNATGLQSSDISATSLDPNTSQLRLQPGSGFAQIGTIGTSITSTVTASNTRASIGSSRASNSKTSTISAYPDSIQFETVDGRFHFPFVERNIVDTTTLKPMVWDESTKRMKVLHGWPSSGSATSLNNVGTGFDLAQQGTANVKRLAMGYGMIGDSTSTEVTLRVDTANVATIAQVQHRIDSLATTTGVAVELSKGTFAQRPASPDTGAIYEQTDRLAGTWKYNGSMWDFLGSPLRYANYEQFVANTTVPKYSVFNSGTGSAQSIVHIKGAGTVLQMNTGTTSLGSSAGGFNSASAAVFDYDSIVVYQEHRVMIPVLSDGTDRFQTMVGWNGHQNQWNFASLIFIYSDNINSGNWTTRTRKFDNSGNMTNKDSGVPVVAGQWYKLGIEVNGFTQTINFYIDDVLVTTHSTSGGDNIPLPNNTTTESYNMGIAKILGTTARIFNVDYSMLYYVKRKYE